jgi:Fe-S cluster biogenesis protein NfuA
MTLRAGIEQAILKMVPEIKSVEAITDEEETYPTPPKEGLLNHQ